MQPLVPADVDLRDFAFMPVDVHRLLTSETWVLGTGEERAAAMSLWLASWHQVPAGSIPNNDRMLAHLSMSRDWPGVKEHVLRSWQLADDGRYYHPVVAEKVLEAWLGKLFQRLKSGCGNAKRWEKGFDPEPIKEDIVLARGFLTALNPKSGALKKKLPATSVDESENDPARNPTAIPVGQENDPARNPTAIPVGQENDPTRNPTAIPVGSQEKGIEKEKEIKDQKLPPYPPGGGDSANAEPSERSRRSPRPSVPYEEIVAAYRQQLPQLAQPKTLSRKRKTAMDKAWALLPERHRLPAVFRAIFAECAQDPFLNGTGPYRGEHSGWEPTFDYLIREDVVAKVYEKAMHRREQQRQQGAGSTTQPTAEPQQVGA